MYESKKSHNIFKIFLPKSLGHLSLDISHRLAKTELDFLFVFPAVGYFNTERWKCEIFWSVLNILPKLVDIFLLTPIISLLKRNKPFWFKCLISWLNCSLKKVKLGILLSFQDIFTKIGGPISQIGWNQFQYISKCISLFICSLQSKLSKMYFLLKINKCSSFSHCFDT